MAFNLTIDDCSPLISYGPSGAWQDTESNVQGYLGNGLHSTTAQGATATINFNGTGIQIYGGHKPEYGTYTLTVDGTTVSSGSASGTIAPQQLLASASGLANGPHTAILTNTGVGMDIDAVNLNAQVGAVGSTPTSTVFDDSNPAVTYAGAWQTQTNNPMYVDGTLHYTQAPGAAASLTFSGNAVAVYGTVSPDHAGIQVSVDGKSALVDGGSDSTNGLHAQTLLYYADGLDDSQHVLIVTNTGQQPGTGPFIDIDAINVYSATSVTSPSPASSPTPAAAGDNGAKPSTVATKSSSGGLSKAALGGIIGGSLFIVLVLLGLFLFLFLRRRKARNQRVMEPKTPLGATLPLQGPRFTPVSPQQPQPTFLSPILTKNPLSRLSKHSIAPSYYASNASRSSFDSTTALVPSVPTLAMPRMPARTQQDRQDVMIPTRGAPGRPPRPPALQLDR